MSWPGPASEPSGGGETTDRRGPPPGTQFPGEFFGFFLGDEAAEGLEAVGSAAGVAVLLSFEVLDSPLSFELPDSPLSVELPVALEEDL